MKITNKTKNIGGGRILQLRKIRLFKNNVHQEEESSNPFHSAAISEPKSGSILLMKAFFFEIAKKKLAQKMSFSKRRK